MKGFFKKSYSVHIVFWSIVFAAIAIDQIIKFFIRNNLEIGQRIVLIPHFFSLHHAMNTGAGFSLFWGMNSLLIWIAIIIIGIILFFYDKITENWYYALAFSLIIGGAIGNVIDRIAQGYVTDFVSFYVIFDYFPSFNIADSCITIGAIIILVYTIFTPDEQEGKKEVKKDSKKN